MFRKKIFIFSALFLILSLTGCSFKKDEKVYKIGILNGLDFFADTADGLKQGMAELGYIEGENIIYDIQRSEVNPAKEKEIVEKFIADKVDLIFTFPTEASITAKAVTANTDIPVLFANANIEDTGLINSIPEPGGNITGVRYPGPDLALKRFEIMHQLFPDTKRIAIPYQAGYPIVKSQIKAVKEVAAPLGIEIIEMPTMDKADIENQLTRLEEENKINFDIILFIPEPLAATPEKHIIFVDFGEKHQIPICGSTMVVDGRKDRGGLFGITTNNVSVGKQAAPLADKILKGTPAGSIFVVSAESVMTVNYAAARAQGIEIPESLLEMADKIIQ